LIEKNHFYMVSMKDPQTAEVSSPSKGTFISFKHEISEFLLFLIGHFAFLDLDPQTDPIGFRFSPDTKHR
jgi:hypothetical protein